MTKKRSSVFEVKKCAYPQYGLWHLVASVCMSLYDAFLKTLTEGVKGQGHRSIKHLWVVCLRLKGRLIFIIIIMA